MAEIQNVDKKSEGELASGNIVRQNILDSLATIDSYVAKMAAGITVTGAVTVNNEAASSVTITNAAITVTGAITVLNAASSSVTILNSVTVSNFGYDANAEQPLPGGTDGSGVLGWLAEINNQQVNTAPTIALSGAYVVQPQIGINPVVGGAGATSAGTQRVVSATDSPDVTKLTTILAAITAQSATLTQIDAALTNSTQKTQIVDGGGNVAAVDSGGDTTSVIESVATQTTSVVATGASDTVIDMAHFRWGVMHISSIGSSLGMILQASNTNNGTDWVTVPVASLPNQAPWSAASISGVGMYGFIPFGRWLRVHITAQTGVAPLIAIIGYATTPPWNTIPNVPTAQQAVSAVQNSGTATQNVWAVGGGPSATSNNGSTAASTGSNITYLNAESWWGMQVIVAGTGSWTTFTILLEGSLDGGTTFFQIATVTAAASTYVANTSGTPALIVRSRITVATAASGTPTLTTKIAGAL